MLDKLKDFRDTLSERLKSPFIGSFMITWSIIHWKVFALFLYNEDKITIQQRIDKVESYLTSQNGCTLIIYPILITLCLLLAYSILNAIGLAIKLLYENWVSPYIQKYLSNPNIIEKSKYEKLKREYSAIKKELDTVTDNSIDTEKNLRELETNFTGFRYKAFEGEFQQEITALWERDVLWENYHTYPDGRTGRETFTCEKEGFNLSDGTKIKVENIKNTRDGKILTFDKVIDKKVLQNYVIRDSKGNYYGVEDDTIIVNYRKLIKPEIIIESAHYGAKDKFVDITQKVSELVSNDMEIKAINEIWGDPIHGELKSLEVEYTVNGINKKIQIAEGASQKIEA